MTPSVGGCWTSTSCFRSPTVLEVAAEEDGPPKRPDILGDLQSFLRLCEGRSFVLRNKSGRRDGKQLMPVTVAVSCKCFPSLGRLGG